MKQAKQKKQKRIGAFRAFCRLAPMVIGFAPILFVTQGLIDIFNGGSSAFITILQQRFFDQAAQLAGGNTTLLRVAPYFLALGGMYILFLAASGVSIVIYRTWYRKVEGSLTAQIHAKIARLDPKIFEDTEQLDDINKAEQGIRNVYRYVHAVTSMLGGFVTYYALMGWYLFTLKPILAVGIALVFIPALCMQIVRARLYTKVEEQSAPLRRECDYYESCLVDREYFKETRLLGGFLFFKRLYTGVLINVQQLTFRANVRANLYELGMRLLATAGYIGILWMLFDSLMEGSISIGAFAAVFAALGNMYEKMEELVCLHLGGVARSVGSVANYLRFLDLPERGGAETVLPPEGDITLQDVSFRYPNTDSNAINNISLTIRRGETVALVGENGSGKTTLIRLITGLYLPDAGEVRYGGISTRDVSLSALYADTSAVFQKYQRYQMTLRENIGISALAVPTADDALDPVSAMAGIDKSAADFTGGYDTMLSREFDGVDLSGGQWQRVAIARGLFRPHNLIILDEPTAAIDPYEETRVYNRFAEISRDKTAMIVTHRLGSVRLADRILVLREGKLVQFGTHDELLAAKGEYARLYHSQEQWYI